MINLDRTKQKPDSAPLQSETVVLHRKFSEARQGGKNLVEFLIARKQSAIAAHKNGSGR